jgi:eukaryotic-like serine/threonine-protein kinase
VLENPCQICSSLALALGMVLVALVATAGTVGATAAPATKIVHFRVFTPAGRIVGVSVTKTLHGSCFSGSIGLPRPDAWRCMAGNFILDPCLESPRGPKVPLVCVTYARDRAVRFVLTKPLPAKFRNRPERRFFAWRLVLANGDVCERFTGTSAGAVQGEGLVYGCTSGGTTTEPNRTRPGWTVRYLAKGRSPFKVKKLADLKLLRVARAIG